MAYIQQRIGKDGKPSYRVQVRKKGYPSYWQLAGDNLQFPEEYENAAVRVRLGPVTIDGKTLVMCDRCRAGVDKRKAKKK